MKKKQPDPEMTDEENPEWTKADFNCAVPMLGLPKKVQKVLSNRGKAQGESTKPGE